GVLEDGAGPRPGVRAGARTRPLAAFEAGGVAAHRTRETRERGAPRLALFRGREETDEVLLLGREATLDDVEVVEGNPGADGDAFERVVGNVAGYARFLREEFVDVAQHSAAAREHDAAVDDVGGELGRGLFEHRPNGVHDGPEAVLDRLCDLDAAERDG